MTKSHQDTEWPPLHVLRGFHKLVLDCNYEQVKFVDLRFWLAEDFASLVKSLV